MAKDKGIRIRRTAAKQSLRAGLAAAGQGGRMGRSN